MQGMQGPLLVRLDLMAGVAAIVFGLVLFRGKIKSFAEIKFRPFAKSTFKLTDDVVAAQKMEMPRIVNPRRQSRSGQASAVVQPQAPQKTLYADRDKHVSASPVAPDTPDLHHPLGELLVERGVLSKLEVSKYLANFNQKKQGHFGEYLVARNAITLAQLELALLQQQEVRSEMENSALPSLQDIENFLADFEPDRHVSVSKFMVLRNAVTPEQLSHILHRQSSSAAVAGSSKA